MKVIKIRLVFLLMVFIIGISLSQRFVVRRPEWHGGPAPARVRLCWNKNREPDLVGYRIFRRCRPFVPNSSLPWTDWGLLIEKYSPTDTTHLDKIVKTQYEYEYKVTAYDSLGNESESSDIIRIHVIKR
jgi:hypothetical protein